MLEEFAPETSAAESWSPSTRRTLSIGSRELADVAAEKPVRVAAAACCPDAGNTRLRLNNGGTTSSRTKELGRASHGAIHNQRRQALRAVTPQKWPYPRVQGARVVAKFFCPGSLHFVYRGRGGYCTRHPLRRPVITSVLTEDPGTLGLRSPSHSATQWSCMGYGIFTGTM